MKTTSLADARAHLSRYVEDVVSTHERVTITRNGTPAVVLISAEDLEALQETLFWASQPPADETGETVGLDVVRADLADRSSAER